MADIFVSYSRQDQERIRPLLALLEEQGYSVWWDSNLQAGMSFRDVIEQELNAAKCVLVIWSQASVDSSFVLDEARYALRRKSMVPVFIDPVSPPFGFHDIQAIDLAKWLGDPNDQTASRLLYTIDALVGGNIESVGSLNRVNVRDAFVGIQRRSPERPMQRHREAKILFVGNPGVGKTSLTRRLTDKYGRNTISRMFRQSFSEHEQQTQGIEIGQITCKTEAGGLHLNLWDFGGQEIMHSTHQFFLSRRSLYVLVLDGRREEDAEYWLKLVETYGGESRVIVVLNKIDENPSFDVNRSSLRDKYWQIADFSRISCKTREGVDELEGLILTWAGRIEHLDTNWPEPWLNIKNNIDKLHLEFVSFDKFEEICNSHNVFEYDEIESIAAYLNDLGAIVHFDAPTLRDTKVLNPNWVTEAVYKILTSKRLAKANGKLLRSDLGDILPRKRFPKSRHDYIIAIMRRFELCFPRGEEEFLIPDLLPVGEPELNFDGNSGLQYKLRYDFLPTSVFPRSLVQLNLDLEDGMAWRDGCVLHEQSFGSRALVRVARRERELSVNVIGNERAEYFSIIRRAILDVSNNPTPLRYQELIPCVCSECLNSERPHYYNYTNLLQRRRKGRDDVDCDRSVESVPLELLLSGIEASEAVEDWDVFVSYSSKDVSVVTDVVEDLKGRSMRVWWDAQQIEPGDSISKKIETGLRKSRFVMPFISRNQINSGWCRVEYASIFHRVINGISTQRLAPLIIDDLSDGEIPMLFSDIHCQRYEDKIGYEHLLAYVSGRS